MQESKLDQQTLDILSEDQRKEALEAVLFAAGYPMTYEKLGETFGMTSTEMRYFVTEYAKEYNEQSRGILLVVMEENCQLCTKEQYKNYIRNAMGVRSSGKLSNSCLEVVALVAYNQPVTKAFVEQIRGVDSSWAVGMLCDKQLIEPKGRLDAPGRPILYGTTDEFLRVFGLYSLKELPTASSALIPKAEAEQQQLILSDKQPENQEEVQ